MTSETPKTKPAGFTVWICETDVGGFPTGTHHITHIAVDNIEVAQREAKIECADSWYKDTSETSLEKLHILGVARGTVEIVEWDEGPL